MVAIAWLPQTKAFPSIRCNDAMFRDGSFFGVIVLALFSTLGDASAKSVAECQAIKDAEGMSAFMQCLKGASASGSGQSKQSCFVAVGQDVDWVFADNGAIDTYVKARASGKGVFDAVMTAQGHNRDAQNRIAACREWIADYVYERGECGKINEGIDWIFRDQGALNSYTSARSSGKSKFQSALFAQRHNQPFQRLMAHCEGYVLVELGSHP